MGQVQPDGFADDAHLRLPPADAGHEAVLLQPQEGADGTADVVALRPRRPHVGPLHAAMLLEAPRPLGVLQARVVFRMVVVGRSRHAHQPLPVPRVASIRVDVREDRGVGFRRRRRASHEDRDIDCERSRERQKPQENSPQRKSFRPQPGSAHRQSVKRTGSSLVSMTGAANRR